MKLESSPVAVGITLEVITDPDSISCNFWPLESENTSIVAVLDGAIVVSVDVVFRL